MSDAPSQGGVLLLGKKSFVYIFNKCLQKILNSQKVKKKSMPADILLILFHYQGEGPWGGKGVTMTFPVNFFSFSLN